MVVSLVFSVGQDSLFGIREKKNFGQVRSQWYASRSRARKKGSYGALVGITELRERMFWLVLQSYGSSTSDPNSLGFAL